MDPITAAMALAQFAPQIVRWITKSDKAADVAQKAVDVATAVTGKPTPDAAIAALQADPNLVLKYRQAVLDQEVEFERIAVSAAEAVNTTMRAEAASERWPQYSWRPAIGFSVAFAVAGAVATVFMAYWLAVFRSDASLLQHLPGILAAIAGIIGVVSPILGIASWFRGKQKLDDGRG